LFVGVPPSRKSAADGMLGLGSWMTLQYPADLVIMGMGGAVLVTTTSLSKAAGNRPGSRMVVVTLALGARTRSLLRPDRFVVIHKSMLPLSHLLVSLPLPSLQRPRTTASTLSNSTSLCSASNTSSLYISCFNIAATTPKSFRRVSFQ
jgi:hypothetical protein